MAYETGIYNSLWSKYRPVVLQMMKASAAEAQQYKLSGHEFKAGGEKNKTGYSFMLEVFNGKALNSISTSTVAKDLLTVLQNSKTGVQLMSESIFEIKMDKHYILHIKRKEIEYD